MPFHQSIIWSAPELRIREIFSRIRIRPKIFSRIRIRIQELKKSRIRIRNPVFTMEFVKILLENEQFLTNLTPGPGSVIFQTDPDPDPRKNNGSRILIRNTAYNENNLFSFLNLMMFPIFEQVC